MSHMLEVIDITGAGSTPIGPASGNLSGTYPAPTVIRINGATVPAAGSLVIGRVLQVSGASALSYSAVDLANTNSVTGVLAVSNLPSLNGNVTGTITANTVVKINGATVPSAGALTIGNTLQVDGASSLTYGPLNLAGGSNYVTGLLPAGNQSAQTMLGDVTGTTGASTVEKIQHYNISTEVPTDGYKLTWVAADGYWAPRPAGVLSLAYGELDTVNGTGTQTLTDADVFYKITQFNDAHLSSGVTPSVVSQNITINKTAVYAINIALSYVGSNNITYTLSVFVNNADGNTYAESEVVSANVSQLNFHEIKRLNAGDVIDVRIKSNSPNKVADVKQACFNLYSIGFV